MYFTVYCIVGNLQRGPIFAVFTDDHLTTKKLNLPKSLTIQYIVDMSAHVHENLTREMVKIDHP